MSVRVEAASVTVFDVRKGFDTLVDERQESREHPVSGLGILNSFEC